MFILNIKKLFTNSKAIVIFATLCCLLWGSAFPFVKTGYSLFKISSGDIPTKLILAGYRFAFAGIIVLFISILMNRKLNVFTKKNIFQIILLGLTQTTLQYIFFYIGVGFTTGTKGSIIDSTGTFFSIIMAHFIYKNDKLSLNKVLGCIIGFLGVIAANFSSDIFNISFSLKGEGMVMLAAFVLSAASIYGKKITQTLDSIVVTGYQLFIGGVVLAIIGRLAGGNLSNFTFTSSLLLVYLAILSSVAFSLWTCLLKYNKVGTISIFNFLVPVFGVLLSSMILKENIFEVKNLFALILVCSGIILANKDN